MKLIEKRNVLLYSIPLLFRYTPLPPCSSAQELMTHSLPPTIELLVDAKRLCKQLMPSVVVGRPRIRQASSSGRRTVGRRVYLNKSGIEYRNTEYVPRAWEYSSRRMTHGPLTRALLSYIFWFKSSLSFSISLSVAGARDTWKKNTNMILKFIILKRNISYNHNIIHSPQ
jgi:hypothetical protein